ncbi:hypothetical protein PMAYCL1PPCAC_26646 [Pristionchus mayeri]|uniref:Homeobox domain-containing protein n=1 Tax=Pristionchus mayeri TaxID=1317129 RepID=A0AAN5D412_9BILA|nr:hypothetical protein PMAYCL1PPCAC_26646 [Pristionchus mayeri]
MMMSFNPSFNPLLAAAAAQMPSTPTKPSEAGSAAPMDDALRAFLAQVGAAGGGVPPSLPAGLFGGAGGATPFGAGGPPSAALPFPFLVQQSDLKSEMMQTPVNGAPAGGPMLPFMDFSGFHPYAMDGVRRKNATRETTAPLKNWLSDHRKNPYPTKAEKVFLAFITKMTLTQVSTWFANARRRLKKENKMTWSPRNRPGEDDDDLADLERPGSSKSDLSDDHNESNNNENNQSPNGTEDSPRKPKSLWSIADTVGVKTEDEAGSSKAASTSPSAAAVEANGAAAGGHAAVLAAMAAAWQQQQFAARQMMQHMQMLAAAGGTQAGATPSLNPYQLMQAMQARLAAAPGGSLGSALNGSLAGIPVSSLSPSSSTHSSDAEKPPTLIDATSEDVGEDYIVKKEETPETPESA